MRPSIAVGAAWLAFYPFILSAPLPSIALHLSTATSSWLRRPQLDITRERREAQLVVPDIFSPRSSQPTSSSTGPKSIITLSSSSNTLAHTKKRSFDHGIIQLNHIGDLVKDQGTEGGDQKGSSGTSINGAQASPDTVAGEATKSSTSSGESTTESADPTPIGEGHAKREEAPTKEGGRPSKGDQKGAGGEGIRGAKPPAAMVKEETKKKGEIHGGCDEVDLAKPIEERDDRNEGAHAGVRWQCKGRAKTAKASPSLAII
ncbi:hypothetical protein FKW77_005448 [Venturia effusa]|uniref:Uncharacterized protein n=1 Tax=Venturia effusa TaxID=50376 RepID=A0A517LDR6_9PEZI|nr:hypothetical protein FKW77_005448 [Venturia effusa]